ncbi:lanthionine synthetase LanC family protein [Sphingomonas crocodyli]|nr:lanthionine synthetase LanC family protein [Sphingomonas crocodyli]
MASTTEGGAELSRKARRDPKIIRSVMRETGIAAGPVASHSRNENLTIKRVYAETKPRPDGTEPLTFMPVILHQAVLWLTSGGLRDRETGMPLSSEFQTPRSEASPAVPKVCGPHRSASHGVGGILYSLARLARLGIKDDRAIAFANQAANWLLAHATAGDQVRGLYFGEAGVALALLEAIRGGLIDDGHWVRPYLYQTFSGELGCPDLIQGAAGQGVAALQAAHLSAMSGPVGFADRCADFLVACQRRDGSWSSPENVIATERRDSGFADETAGIAYFLAVHARLRASETSAAAAVLAGDWLLAQCDPKLRSHATAGRESWPLWCHGEWSIVTALLALHELTGDARWACGVRSMLLDIRPEQVRQADLSQCLGLAGLAEIYLEAARVLHDDVWTSRAHEIGATLAGLRRTQDHMTSWVIERTDHATAEIMIRSGSIAHCLGRLHAGTGTRLGMPLSIDVDIVLPTAPLRREAPAGQEG